MITLALEVGHEQGISGIETPAMNSSSSSVSFQDTFGNEISGASVQPKSSSLSEGAKANSYFALDLASIAAKTAPILLARDSVIRRSATHEVQTIKEEGKSSSVAVRNSMTAGSDAGAVAKMTTKRNSPLVPYQQAVMSQSSAYSVTANLGSSAILVEQITILPGLIHSDESALDLKVNDTSIGSAARRIIGSKGNEYIRVPSLSSAVIKFMRPDSLNTGLQANLHQVRIVGNPQLSTKQYSLKGLSSIFRGSDDATPTPIGKENLSELLSAKQTPKQQVILNSDQETGITTITSMLSTQRCRLHITLDDTNRLSRKAAADTGKNKDISPVELPFPPNNTQMVLQPKSNSLDLVERGEDQDAISNPPQATLLPVNYGLVLEGTIAGPQHIPDAGDPSNLNSSLGEKRPTRINASYESQFDKGSVSSNTTKLTQRDPFVSEGRAFIATNTESSTQHFPPSLRYTEMSQWSDLINSSGTSLSKESSESMDLNSSSLSIEPPTTRKPKSVCKTEFGNNESALNLSPAAEQYQPVVSKDEQINALAPNNTNKSDIAEDGKLRNKVTQTQIPNDKSTFGAIIKTQEEIPAIYDQVSVSIDSIPPSSGKKLLTALSTEIAVAQATELPMSTHSPGTSTMQVLEVNVPGGTEGWLKVRAEITGQSVHASLSATSVATLTTLHQEANALNTHLQNERIPVTVSVENPTASLSSYSHGDDQSRREQHTRDSNDQSDSHESRVHSNVTAQEKESSYLAVTLLDNDVQHYLQDGGLAQRVSVLA